MPRQIILPRLAPRVYPRRRPAVAARLRAGSPDHPPQLVRERTRHARRERPRLHDPQGHAHRLGDGLVRQRQAQELTHASLELDPDEAGRVTVQLAAVASPPIPTLAAVATDAGGHLRVVSPPTSETPRFLARYQELLAQASSVEGRVSEGSVSAGHEPPSHASAPRSPARSAAPYFKLPPNLASPLQPAPAPLSPRGPWPPRAPPLARPRPLSPRSPSLASLSPRSPASLARLARPPRPRLARPRSPRDLELSEIRTSEGRPPLLQ